MDRLPIALLVARAQTCDAAQLCGSGEPENSALLVIRSAFVGGFGVRLRGDDLGVRFANAG